MNRQPLLVLLIEDDVDLAATVSDHLSLENIACDHAYNGQAGLKLAREQRFDVIVLDLTLPKLDGLSVCQILRREGSDCPVLMLTARDQMVDKIAGFEAGTDDYMVKPFAFEEMAARIRSLAGRRSGNARVLQIGDLRLDLDRQQAVRKERQLRLSPTGWVLLQFLARKSPQLVTREQLERAVWGEDPPDSDSLKVHLHKLRYQVQRPFETELLHTIPGAGTVLRVES